MSGELLTPEGVPGWLFWALGVAFVLAFVLGGRLFERARAESEDREFEERASRLGYHRSDSTGLPGGLPGCAPGSAGRDRVAGGGDVAGRVLRLDDLLGVFRVGSGDWSWQEEYDLLYTQPWQATLTEQIAEEGIREPVLLGSDGRVWDGHHRICAAMHLGLDEVPVEWSADSGWLAAHDAQVEARVLREAAAEMKDVALLVRAIAGRHGHQRLSVQTHGEPDSADDVCAWAPYWVETEGLTQDAYIEWAAEYAEEGGRAHRLLMRATVPVRDDRYTDRRDESAMRGDLWRRTRGQQ